MTDDEQAHKAEHIDVWEIVEDHDYPYIAQLIEDAKVHFEQTTKLVLADYKTALHDLLNYTGGWDIEDKDHPIFEARAALNKKLDI